MPVFKHEIAPDPGQPLDFPTQKPQVLDKDRESLEEKIEKSEEKLESLAKLLSRSSDSRLHNKVNEIQEEICQRRYELYVAQIHLSAVRAQLQLFEYNFRPRQAASFGLGQAGISSNVSDSLLGGSSISSNLIVASSSQSDGTSGGQSSGYKSKWIKAFKSLRDTSTPVTSGQSTGRTSETQAGKWVHLKLPWPIPKSLFLVDWYWCLMLGIEFVSPLLQYRYKRGVGFNQCCR